MVVWAVHDGGYDTDTWYWGALLSLGLTAATLVVGCRRITSSPLALPWSAEGALVALLAFTLGVGLIALVILLRLASAYHVSAPLLDGRLAAATGDYNATVALFSTDALLAIVMASCRLRYAACCWGSPRRRCN